MLQYSYKVPLNRHCTFCIGGKAERLSYAYTNADLIEAEKDGALVLGKGSNVLFGDYGYGGSVVINRADGFFISGNECVCQSGVLLSRLSREYARLGLKGLEWACDLPGTIGGAVAGNAGAFGGSMGECVKSVTVSYGGELYTLKADDCGFGYRKSDIKGVIVCVTLFALKGDRAAIADKCRQNSLLRKQTQPSGASAGCVFKSFGGESAGRLMDICGLKGLTAGGAQISQKHANFIINRGGCSASDVLQLINTARAVVYQKTGIMLENEIKLIGDF